MISNTQRENYKTILGCTDEQIDELVKISVDARANGIHFDFDRFVLLVSREISMSEFGYSADEFANNKLELSTSGLDTGKKE